MGSDTHSHPSGERWRYDALDRPVDSAMVDCHTHTYVSGDSNTTIDEFVEAFERSGLTHVFVTDHQSISAYPPLQEVLGPRVICGQEQRVAEGEVIGLFLTNKIPAGLKLADASKAIRDQGGIVYICHPLDKKRFSIGYGDLVAALENEHVDAIELYNSKSLAVDLRLSKLSSEYGIPMLGGSDAHVASAIGSSGAAMPWFDSAATFLEAASSATAFGCHCDPRKSWPLRVVPPTPPS